MNYLSHLIRHFLLSEPVSKFVPNRISFLSLFVLLGLWGAEVRPASAQALLPYTLQLDFEVLEDQGLGLAQEAAQLTQFQQYEMALSRAQLATQLAPNTYQTWALLGSIYLQLDETREGIKALKQAQRLESGDPAVLFTLGSAYFREAEYSISANYLKAGLQIQPDTTGALFDLGNAYYKLNLLDEAITEYQKAVDQDEKFWPAVNNIGLVLYEQNDTDGAIKKWRSAIEISEQEAEPQLAVAVALYTNGDAAAQQQALDLGTKALETDIRYGDLAFLEENLWGTRLLEETNLFLQIPKIQALIEEG